MSNVLFKIRSANLNDATAIATIGFKSWHDSYTGLISEEHLSSINLNQQIDKCGLAIKNGKNFLIATDDLNTPIGYTQFGIGRASPKENEIYALYVSKHIRSKGLGSILLFEVEKRFASSKPILIRVLKENLRARKFIETNQYRYVSGRDGIFRGIAPDVAYVKVL